MIIAVTYQTTLNGGTADITIREIEKSSNSIKNESTITAKGGYRSTKLSGFEGANGDNYYDVLIDMHSDDPTSSPVIEFVSITAPEMKKVPYVKESDGSLDPKRVYRHDGNSVVEVEFVPQ